jgi:hypothetical protein
LPPHRRRISDLNLIFYVRFEVPTAVVMKSSILWDIKPYSPLKVNRCFGGTYRLHFHLFDPEDRSDMFLRNFGWF